MEKGWIDKTGSLRQFAGTRHGMLTNGAANGTRVIDVYTGAGLQFTVLPDRGMDIGVAFYKGVNFTYLSPQEEMNPAFCRIYENEWLRTFFGGLLTTCGPLNFGPACEDEGEKLGIHGRFNCTPAKNVCDRSEIENGVIELTGTIDDYMLFGEKVDIKRTIRSEAGRNIIKISDHIMNRGAEPVPLMMLYHINFGYPFLDSHTITETNSSRVEGYDAYSSGHMDSLHGFSEPEEGNLEKNYLHCFNAQEGWARVVNGDLGFAVSVRFDTRTLPYLSHWKCERLKDYILALEPCNSPCISRKELREKGMLQFLGPGETSINRIEIEIESTLK
jgi:hypothetical protein